jgi:hypothetical protein
MKNTLRRLIEDEVSELLLSSKAPSEIAISVDKNSERLIFKFS